MRYRILGLVLLASALASCSPYTGVNVYPGAPRFAPTYPGDVVLLRHEPRRPHIRLGEVWIRPEHRWSPFYVEQKLREQTAKIGGHALVIVEDRFTANPVIVRDYWRGNRVYRERVIVGVAIRYQGP